MISSSVWADTECFVVTRLGYRWALTLAPPYVQLIWILMDFQTSWWERPCSLRSGMRVKSLSISAKEMWVCKQSRATWWGKSFNAAVSKLQIAACRTTTKKCPVPALSVPCCNLPSFQLISSESCPGQPLPPPVTPAGSALWFQCQRGCLTQVYEDIGWKGRRLQRGTKTASPGWLFRHAELRFGTYCFTVTWLIRREY